MDSGHRVLLAEDEKAIAAPIISRLTEAGHDVRWVQAMRELRSSMPDFQPHILLLDVTLDTDGLEFFQAVRFAPEHPPAGVVMLTPPGDVRIKERAQQLGAAAVVAKPVDPEQLTTVVADLLTCLN